MVPWIDEGRSVPSGYIPSTSIDTLPGDEAIFAASSVLPCSKVDLLVSPDHLSLPDNPLISAIESAEEEVLCELLDIDPSFDLDTIDHAIYPLPSDGGVVFGGYSSGNPYVEALFRAAANGAKVRMILDGSDFDSDSEPDNQWIAKMIRSEVSRRGLEGVMRVELMPSGALMGDQEIGLVHNKGVIIDRRTCWISSLNWGPTSALENREVGLLVDSGGLCEVLADCFELDWGQTLQDEVEIRKQGWTLKPLNDTWISASITVTMTSDKLQSLRLALFGGSLKESFSEGFGEGVACRNGNASIVTYDGPLPRTGELILLASDGERTAYITALKVEMPERQGDEDWDSPFYRDPLFPLLLMIVVPIALSLPIAIFKFRRKGRVSEGTEE